MSTYLKNIYTFEGSAINAHIPGGCVVGVDDILASSCVLYVARFSSTGTIRAPYITTSQMCGGSQS